MMQTLENLMISKRLLINSLLGLVIILTTLFKINFKDLFFNQNLKLNIFIVFLFFIFLLSVKIFQNYNTIVIFN